MYGDSRNKEPLSIFVGLSSCISSFSTEPLLPLIYLFLTLVLLNKLNATPTSNFQPIRLLDPDCGYKFAYLMANSADPDQLASSEAN